MIAIVDYGMGNVKSVLNALKLIGVPATLTADPHDLERSTHLILPGVGAFPDGMQALSERGLIPLLSREIQEKRKPFLGICLGMQLLADHGEEGGSTQGLGWIAGKVRRLRVGSERLPHIGWNNVAFGENPLLSNITDPTFYFVHSYVFVPAERHAVIGTCEYGETFAAILQQGNVFGTQFHPEKSQKSGLALLKNFASLTVC